MQPNISTTMKGSSATPGILAKLSMPYDSLCLLMIHACSELCLSHILNVRISTACRKRLQYGNIGRSVSLGLVHALSSLHISSTKLMPCWPTHLPSFDILHNLLFSCQCSLRPSVLVSIPLGQQQRDEVDSRPGLFPLQFPVRQYRPSRSTRKSRGRSEEESTCFFSMLP